MKAFKEKRNTFHALLGMGIVILCVFALALAACGDSNTGTIDNPNPGTPGVVVPTIPPGGNTDENGGENGGTLNPPVPTYVTGFYITASPTLFDAADFVYGTTENLDLGGYFDAVIADTALSVVEQGALLDSFLRSFPLSYEGDAPNLSGLKVKVTYSDGTIKDGDLGDFRTKPAVLGHGDVSPEFGSDIPGGTAGTDVYETADLKRSVQVYHKDLEGFSRSVFIPVVIPIDRTEGTNSGRTWDSVREGTKVAKVFEDDEAPVLTGASVFVNYFDKFKVGEYGSSEAIELDTGVLKSGTNAGFKEVKLTAGHVFGDYYDEFGTSTARPSDTSTYTRNGIDGGDVYVLISAAGPLEDHDGGSNATVFTKVGITNQVYIRQVEINKPLEWKIKNGDVSGDAFYLQGQAANRTQLVTDLLAAGLELKVTYNDGSYSIRDADYVKRAIAFGNAGIPPDPTVAGRLKPYENGNDRNADKFIEDWDSGILGYFTFAYYSSLLPTYQRRIGQEGDYQNFVFGYNQVDVRPRIPVATYVVGSGRLELKEGYPAVEFVGRYEARVADTTEEGGAAGMTNSEYKRIAEAYKFVGDYVFGTTPVDGRELIALTAENNYAQKAWFNRGRDPFVNRNTEELFEMRPVPFAVPKGTHNLFDGEGQEDFEIKTYNYAYSANRP